MTPEERALLERTAAMAEENNRLLQKMQRRSRWQIAFQVSYWVIILALTFGAFFFIQPYIDAITGSLGQGNQSFSQELQSAMSQYGL